MNYSEAEAYINSIPRFSKVKNPENVDDILALYGHPEKHFSYVHVAGTNGKGSVCAFLDSMLRAAGKRTGLFSSPHLITTRERIKVDGEDIPEEDFASLCEELLSVVRQRQAQGYPHPTYFEWLYLMAMIWFDRQGIEYGVIETGLGGRLDATNHIERPAVTVITSISYDHTEILGPTLTDIAGEKAGIIKAGVPVIADGSEKEALAVIDKRARQLNCPLEVLEPRMVKILLNRGKNIDFLFNDLYDGKWMIRLNTGALYQPMNAGLAWMTMQRLRKQDETLNSVGEDRLLRAIADTRWPGRMEEILPNVFVDGAHNVGGIRKLRETLEKSLKDRPLWLVFAVANDKDYEQMIKILCEIPSLKGVIVTEISGGRKTDLAAVAAIFKKNWHGYTGYSYNINEAVIEGRKKADCCEGGILVCAGSLYLAGAVLEALKDLAQGTAGPAVGGQTDD